MAALEDWTFWGRTEQHPPQTDWSIWLFLGGRGAGKTRAGAEWVSAQVRSGCRRVALVAPTLGDAREVMIDGPSGLKQVSHWGERPTFEVSRRRLVWPCGAIGYVFSAEDADSLRGPQFDCAWADAAIDAVAIDWYAPASDWRDGAAHLDAQLWPSIHDPAYLHSNIAGGEGYDWYYASDADRDAQLRTPITDGGAGKPWVFRYKDLVNWWSQPHHNRPGGIEIATPTDWVPQSKPVWITEVGCPAVDMGANQPNVFVDPKSSESTLPHYSGGTRDDLIQRRYLEAFHRYWDPDAGHNPVSSVYGGPMLDTGLIHVWTWDARPFPDFPAREEVWADGVNWRLGHWLSGRAGLAPLAGVVGEVSSRCGLEADVSGLDGLVPGFILAGPVTGRSALEPLSLAFGFTLRESGDGARFIAQHGAVPVAISPEQLVLPDQGDVLRRNRAPVSFLPANVRLRFIGDALDYEPGSALAHLDGSDTGETIDHVWPLLGDAEQARFWARSVLLDVQADGDRMSVEFPPSLMALEPGDAIRLANPSPELVYTIDVADGNETRRVSARRYLGRPASVRGSEAGAPGVPPGYSRPAVAILDIPLLAEESADRNGVLIAASASPWPGRLVVHAGADTASLESRGEISRRTVFGESLNDFAPGQAARWQFGRTLDVRLDNGALASSPRVAVLNGANRLAVETVGGWLILQFASAELIGANTYRLAGLLHGDLAAPAAIAAGAHIVVLEVLPDRLPLQAYERGAQMELRAGHPRLPLQSPFQAEASFTYLGRDLAPLSPVHLRWKRVSDGYLFCWIRRSRTGGDDWTAPITPLGESFEAYQVRLGDGESELAVLETTEPEYLLTDEDAATIYAGGGMEPVFIVAQLSDRYGPGAASQTSFTL